MMQSKRSLIFNVKKPATSVGVGKNIKEVDSVLIVKSEVASFYFIQKSQRDKILKTKLLMITIQNSKRSL